MFATSFYWNFCLVHYVYFQRFFLSKDLNENYLALMSDKIRSYHNLLFFGYSERLLAPLEKDSKLPKCGSDPIVRAKKLTTYLWIRAKIARKFDCKFIVCCFTCIHMVQFSRIWHHASLRRNGVKYLNEHSFQCLIKFWHLQM